jgi:transaldolase
LNSIQLLQKQGASVWLDFISRGLLNSGELKRLIDQGVTGVTSNPSIFQKVMCEPGAYDEPIARTRKAFPTLSIEALYEKMAVHTIQMAADELKSVYDSTGGTDGYVSLEVSPHLSTSTENTIIEARKLWKEVGKPNLMIKVPATPEGIPVVEALIAEGININATLIFSLDQYSEVAQAYIRGLARNPQPAKVASVASYFVSRIDTAVDKALDKTGIPEALALRGKTAVACCKMVYRRFNEIFYRQPFAAQAKRGGRVQKLVWGSTGTKNPQYSDVLYVEEIVGKDTINTIPLPTLKAFLDHGKVRQSLTENMSAAEKNLADLKKFNINLDSITDQLLKEGVIAFIQAYDQLIDSLKVRCGIK